MTRTTDQRAALVGKLRVIGHKTASRAADEIEALAARVEALETALVEIRDYHIPSQPMAYGEDDLAWAQRQHGQLRLIALRALRAFTPRAPT